MPAIPLSELKAHLNLTSGAHDDELLDVLEAAEEWAGRYINVALGSASRSFSVYPVGTSLILPIAGVTGLTSVIDPGGVDATALSTANLSAGIVSVPYARTGAWTVTVATNPVVPSDVRLAVLIIAAHLWETQRGAAQSPVAVADQGLEDEALHGVGYAIPNRARALLDPHLLPTAA